MQSLAADEAFFLPEADGVGLFIVSLKIGGHLLGGGGGERS
jgi:hypothetical protein